MVAAVVTREREMIKLLSPFVVAGAAIVAVIAMPTSSLAFEPDPYHCYSTAPLWNAPRGAIVSGTSEGPIRSVLNGVGETRTHSMISNGDWATHSTSLQPSIKTVNVTIAGIKVGTTPDSDKPLKPSELAAGQPGFSQIDMGGAYAYWRGASQTWTQIYPPPLATELANPSLCGNGCKAAGTADWLWASAPYQASGTMYLLGWLDQAGNVHHLSYGLHQFMNGIDRITTGLETEDWGGRGIVCSQVEPYAYVHWVNETNPYITSGTGAMTYQTYSHAETANAGNALWYSVYNQCMGADPGFWASLASGILSLYYGGSIQDKICNHAAWQVLNCFFEGETTSSGGCSDISSGPWNSFVPNNSRAGAQSLSPEGLMGLNGKPANGPWKNWTQGALQWNGGGSVYGCYW
jgi:hypothetical protein